MLAWRVGRSDTAPTGLLGDVLAASREVVASDAEDLMTATEVAELLGWSSPSTPWDLSKKGSFPAPVRRHGRTQTVGPPRSRTLGAHGPAPSASGRSCGALNLSHPEPLDKLRSAASSSGRSTSERSFIACRQHGISEIATESLVSVTVIQV